MNEKLSNETSECIILICVYFQSLLICSTHEKVSLFILYHNLQKFVSGSPAPGLYTWLSSRMRTAHLQKSPTVNFL